MSEEISFLIVIPTLNSFDKLKRFRKSIISQDFKNWRVIYVDANSNKGYLNRFAIIIKIKKPNP